MRFTLYIAGVMAAFALGGCATPPPSALDAQIAAVAAAHRATTTDPVVRQRVTMAAWKMFPQVPPTNRTGTEPPPRQTAPRLIKNVPPVYPFSARVSNEQAIVWVAFLINREGTPTGVSEIEDETGTRNLVLVASALNAVAKWRFLPATLDGKPVETVIAVPVVFELDRRASEPKYDASANEAFQENEVASQLLSAFFAKHPGLPPRPPANQDDRRLLTAPRLISPALYGYPQNWRTTMEKIWVTVWIDTEGRVSDVACSPDPSRPGAPRHAGAVARAVATWRFTPHLLDGKPFAAVNVFAVVTDGTHFYLRNPAVF